MARQHYTPVGSDALASGSGCRGPFTLGLSRLTGYRSQKSSTSRRKAGFCFALALGVSIMTAQWILSDPGQFSGSPDPSSFTRHTASPAIQSILGGTGLLASLGCGLAGLWFWPFNKRIRVQPREESLAAYDHVTGLPALRLFTVLLDQALTRASHMGRHVGVLVAELQQFRPLPASVDRKSTRLNSSHT